MSNQQDPWAQPYPNQYDQNQGTQGYGAQGYGSYDVQGGYQPGYPYQPYANPVEEPNKGPGRTAFILALVALAISIGLSVVCGMSYAEIFEVTGSSDIKAEELPPELENTLMTAGLTILGQVVPTIMGIIALVLSGRAMGKPGSKGLGIAGLVTALLAPFISLAVFLMVVIPAVPQG